VDPVAAYDDTTPQMSSHPHAVLAQTSDTVVWLALVAPMLIVLALGVVFIVAGLRNPPEAMRFDEDELDQPWTPPTFWWRVREAWWRFRYRLARRNRNR